MTNIRREELPQEPPLPTRVVKRSYVDGSGVCHHHTATYQKHDGQWLLSFNGGDSWVYPASLPLTRQAFDELDALNGVSPAPASTSPPSWANVPVMFAYTNHRGSTRSRWVVPLYLWFGSTSFHPKPTWLLHAWDLDKKAERDFDLAKVESWNVDGLPALTAEEKAAMDALPMDFVERLLRGERPLGTVTIPDDDCVFRCPSCRVMSVRFRRGGTATKPVMRGFFECEATGCGWWWYDLPANTDVGHGPAASGKDGR